MTLQDDGNLVLAARGKPLWHTDSAGKKDVRITIHDDRNFVLYSGKDAVWSSGTHTDQAPPPPEVATPVEQAAPNVGQVLTIPE